MSLAGITRDLVSLAFQLGNKSQNEARDVFWKKHLESDRGKYGSLDEPSSHVWTTNALDPNTGALGDIVEDDTDRMVYIPVTRSCSRPQCGKQRAETMMYPVILLGDMWYDASGTKHKMSGVEEVLQRVVLQQSGAESGKCGECRRGKVITTKHISEISLPSLLALEFGSVGFSSDVEKMDIPHTIQVCRGWEYDLVAVALYRPGHYKIFWLCRFC